MAMSSEGSLQPGVGSKDDSDIQLGAASQIQISSEDFYYEHVGVGAENGSDIQVSSAKLEQISTSFSNDVFDDDNIPVVNVIIENWDEYEVENDASNRMTNSNSTCLRVEDSYMGENELGVEVLARHPDNLLLTSLDTSEADINSVGHLGDDSFNCESVHENPNFARETKDTNILGTSEKIVPSSTKIDGLRCPHCPKTFTLPGNCDCHIKVVHGGVRFECHKCHRQFTCNSMLQRHIHVTHENVQCRLCSQVFKTDHARTAHKCKARERRTSVVCNYIIYFFRVNL